MKQTLRIRFRELEQNRPADAVMSGSRAIYEQLIQMDVFRKARRIGAFLSLPSEVQTGDIIKACWDSGKDVCVPFFMVDVRRYGMSRLAPGTPLKLMRLNLREPEHPDPVDCSALDLMLVPALAFDLNGVRLGHGGGHYDRLLAGFKGYRLGLAFHEQIVDQLPSEPHDEPVQAILTEQKFIEVGQS